LEGGECGREHDCFSGILLSIKSQRGSWGAKARKKSRHRRKMKRPVKCSIPKIERESNTGRGDPESQLMVVAQRGPFGQGGKTVVFGV